MGLPQNPWFKMDPTLQIPEWSQGEKGIMEGPVEEFLKPEWVSTNPFGKNTQRNILAPCLDNILWLKMEIHPFLAQETH